LASDGRGRAVRSRRILPATPDHGQIQNTLDGAAVIRAWTTSWGR
jgi:hypothetical protein